MNAPRIIPKDIKRVQIEASDPTVSVFVAANAGSGKTHVLAQRVIRLLLTGVDPAKILCLTFTKAAAANMANRVFDTLANWTTLDDDMLDGRIEEFTKEKPDARKRALARRLFALALETPGGLKVQTIHAFCTQLLHAFPFEANVAARFSVLDESDETKLLEDLSLAVLLDAAGAPNSDLGRALATAITAAADQTFKELINEAVRERDTIERWIMRTGSVEAAFAELSHALGIGPDDSTDSLEAELFNGSLIAESEWPAILATLAEGSDNDRKQMKRLATAQATTGSERVRAYRSIFCTAEPDLGRRQNIVTGTIARKYPELAARLTAEQDRICTLLGRQRAVACRERTWALFTVVREVLSRCRAEKDRRGLLNYDDLIDKTLALFADTAAAWVHYKLDLGIDHLLIDEAQDTSPKQWDIIKTLVAEFTAGAGARAVTRTLFAVGDEKQSIFSFQGAVPDLFADMRKHFKQTHEHAGIGFVSHEFTHSFRSGASVLGAVDEVFRSREVFASVTSDTDGVAPHIALPDAAPGLVEIWPLFKADEKRQIEAWDAPFDTLKETSPHVRLAERIARTVGKWEREGRRPGDVLILVRQRGPLFEATIRALKNEDIAVAGADRLVLTEHIAVMDLMALADALLLPDDDLALASVLKSPLFGYNEGQLFDLAWNRTGALRAALRAKAPEIAARLDWLTEAARRETPFAFYAHLLGREHGRKNFLARLGLEAADPLDEFLNLALDYESREAPSLQGFVAWLRTARAEVKRDMEITRDEVRVMTVHGAKGLEAPIVILADTTTKPTGPRDRRLLRLGADGAPMIWAGRIADDTGPLHDARERARREARNEYRRLLYVAMTRASERLIVAGYEGVQRRPAGCWYDLVCDALSPLAGEEPGDDGEPVLRFRRPGPESATTEQPKIAPPQKEIILPEWLRRDAPKPSAVMSSMMPSAAGDEEFSASRQGDRRKAMLRGRLVHRLMQSLPDIPPPRRAEAARRHLARAAGDFSEEERQMIAAQAAAVLDDARFAPLFAPGSRAEVPIVGRIARGGAPLLPVSGVVDRLAVTADAVLIADYKTNHPAPRRVEDVPPAYIRQLALYRAVLSLLYPGRPIAAALLWTEIPDLMEISADALDRALAQLTSA